VKGPKYLEVCSRLLGYPSTYLSYALPWEEASSNTCQDKRLVQLWVEKLTNFGHYI
jgi:hypothetical protein